MAKSFYTLEEAAAKLKKSAAEVNSIADTGRLQRVMHEGQQKFRVEQVDILASFMNEGGVPRLDDSQGPIGLADSASGSAIGAAPPPSGRRPAAKNEDSVLGLSDTALGKTPSLIDSSERTGVSAVGNRNSGDAVEIGLETVGSGSGLLDLTRESEETALGAELIDQVYSSESGDAASGASGLFEAVNAAPAFGAPAPMTGMVVAEAYDGAWSGVGVGLMVAALVGLVFAGLIALSVVFGGSSGIASSFSGNVLAWGGSLAGIAAVFGLVGFFVGRASE